MLLLAGPSYAQTTLQRCLGITPGQFSAKIGPSPATMSYCRQLPAWNLYEQAGEWFNAGDKAGAACLALSAPEAGNQLAAERLAQMCA